VNGVRQGWLVAKREIRERSRSRAFLASLALMAVAVAAVLIIPALLKPGGGTKDIGLTGPTPPTLAATISQQAHAAGVTVHVHRYASLAAGEQATRQGRLDVLVAGAQRLEWPGRADQQLQAVLTGAIQLVTVRERAAAAGISPGAAAALLAPAPVSTVELGHVAGRSPTDELAAIIITGVLLMCISIFGSMVLTGVLEEKSSRVVEVLLARIPARALLAGKIAGIGLLGLAQIAVTALAALIAITAVGSIDIPAVRGAVLAWAVVWFVLGYALYATVFGALGSLGSRAEDAQAVAGPAQIVLLVAYFASFFMITQPASAAAKAISYFPLTAPLAMPGRIAMGATAWWEPVLAVAITLATIIGLVVLAGRLYTNAILHGGPRLSLQDAWRSATAVTPTGTTPAPSAAEAGARATTTGRPMAHATTEGRTTMTRTGPASHRLLITVLTGIGVALGVAVAVLTSDVIIGVAAGAGFIAVANMMVRLWTGHPGPPVTHH
jgi:ABC-2 type transport system permease protein